MSAGQARATDNPGPTDADEDLLDLLDMVEQGDEHEESVDLSIVEKSDSLQPVLARKPTPQSTIPSETRRAGAQFHQPNTFGASCDRNVKKNGRETVAVQRLAEEERSTGDSNSNTQYFFGTHSIASNDDDHDDDHDAEDGVSEGLEGGSSVESISSAMGSQLGTGAKMSMPTLTDTFVRGAAGTSLLGEAKAAIDRPGRRKPKTGGALPFPKKLVAQGVSGKVMTPPTGSNSEERDRIQSSDGTTGPDQRESKTATSSPPKPASSTPIRAPLHKDHFEPHCNLSIKDRVVSMADVDRCLQGKACVKVSGLKTFVTAVGKTQAKGFVLIGVLCGKTTRTGKNNKPYQIWKLTDMKRTEVSLFLFGRACEYHNKTQEGSITLIQEPEVLPDRQGKKADTFSVSASKPDQILRIGAASAFGFCKGTTKAGATCRNWVNRTLGDYCDYHVTKAYKQAESGRMDINQNARVRTTVRNSVKTNLSGGGLFQHKRAGSVLMEKKVQGSRTSGAIHSIGAGAMVSAPLATDSTALHKSVLGQRYLNRQEQGGTGSLLRPKTEGFVIPNSREDMRLKSLAARTVGTSGGVSMRAKTELHVPRRGVVPRSESSSAHQHASDAIAAGAPAVVNIRDAGPRGRQIHRTATRPSPAPAETVAGRRVSSDVGHDDDSAMDVDGVSDRGIQPVSPAPASSTPSATAQQHCLVRDSAIASTSIGSFWVGDGWLQDDPMGVVAPGNSDLCSPRSVVQLLAMARQRIGPLDLACGVPGTAGAVPPLSYPVSRRLWMDALDKRCSLHDELCEWHQRRVDGIHIIAPVNEHVSRSKRIQQREEAPQQPPISASNPSVLMSSSLRKSPQAPEVAAPPTQSTISGERNRRSQESTSTLGADQPTRNLKPTRPTVRSSPSASAGNSNGEHVGATTRVPTSSSKRTRVADSASSQAPAVSKSRSKRVAEASMPVVGGSGETVPAPSSKNGTASFLATGVASTGVASAEPVAKRVRRVGGGLHGGVGSAVPVLGAGWARSGVAESGMIELGDDLDAPLVHTAPVNRTSAQRAKEKALKTIQRMGGILPPDPNSTGGPVSQPAKRYSRKATLAVAEREVAAARARRLAQSKRGPGGDVVDAQPALSKARNQVEKFFGPVVALQSEAGQALMNARGLQEEAGLQDVAGRADDHIDRLEEQEKLARKMESVKELQVRAVTCHICHYTAEKLRKTCQAERHSSFPGGVTFHTDATKRWFRCTHCRSRTSTINSLMCIETCQKCGQMSWERVSMYRGHKLDGATMPSDELLPRGHEWANSLKSLQ